MITLERKRHQEIGTTMFVRPQRPEDHDEFEWLLPQCTPLFVYRDGGGRDWVRWALPRDVAREIGWGEMKCACCTAGGPLQATNDDFHIDTAYNEVDWYLERIA